MMLTGHEIKQRLGNDIGISPFNESQLGPNSYNLRLGDTLMQLSEVCVDVKRKPEYVYHKMDESGFLLEPGNLYLAHTDEFTVTHNLVPMIEGRSSFGRIGLFVHVTAGFGDIGFRGRWTLELMVIRPTIIYPLIEICQIFYHQVSGYIEREYTGKYQNSNTVRGCDLWKDFESVTESP
jgi:dCTP deaminase